MDARLNLFENVVLMKVGKYITPQVVPSPSRPCPP